MKPQSVPRSTKSKIQEPKLDRNGHKRAASKSKPRSACELLKKPLAGRLFYLDVPCNKRSLTLESDIKSLGGTVEKFFSKEIRYLVSNKPEARHVYRLVLDSPVPSPDSGLSSPHPASKRDSIGHRGSSQGPADTVVVSRGKSLVEKVVKEQKQIQINRILANAIEWGVKIIYIEDIISYIVKKKAEINEETHTVKIPAQPDPKEKTAFQKCSAGRISRPFIKVEDSSRHYRPIYLPMANMPVCNFKSAAPCSPFLVEDNDDAPGKKSKVPRSERERAVKGRKDRRKDEGKARRKGGYCECCLVKYDRLKAHLQSEQHQAFSKSEEYLVVDRVISGLTCDLIQISSQTKRVKCSVSSPVFASGAVVKKKGQDGVLEVEDKMQTEFLLWSSHNTDCSGGTPQLGRKRCRKLSQSPGEDTVEQSDAQEKSESKRGSFEWCCGSNDALHASLSSARKGFFSDTLERNRRSLQVYSKTKTSPNEQPDCQHVRTLQSMSSGQKLGNSCNCLGATSKWETQGTNVASEPSGISKLNCQKTQSLLDITCKQLFNERSSTNSTHVPVRTEQPSDRPQSSRRHESASTDSPTKTLQRKVRNLRRKRKVPTETLPGLSANHVESLTPQTFDKPSEPQSFSPSALDMWQLFKSSDDTDEDFKGFYD